MAAAIAAGGELTALVTALAEREQQRLALRQQLDVLDGLSRVSSLDLGRVEKDLRARVKEWRALLGRQRPVARQIVTKLLDDKRIVFTPHEDRSGEFTGRAHFGKLLQECYRRYGVPNGIR